MKWSIIKLTLSLALIAGLVLAIGASTKDGAWKPVWEISLILVAFPIFIMTWFDFSEAVRQLDSPHIAIKIFAILFGIPQALFGLISIGIGVSLIVWVIYNLLIEQQAQYTGGLLTLGFGPAMVLFGYVLVRSVFVTNYKPGA